METYILSLVGELRSRGFEVHAVLPETAKFDQWAQEVSEAGAVVTRLNTDAREGRIGQLPRLWSFVRLLRRIRPNVVHLHTGGATGGLATLLFARVITRASVVLTEHDIPKSRFSRWQRLTKKLSSRFSHTVTVGSWKLADVRAELVGFQDPRVVSLPIGISLKPVVDSERSTNRAKVRGQLRIPADAVVVGTAIRLAENKGLDVLLRGFSVAHQQAPCKLVVVGDGPLRGQLELLAADLGVADDVEFVGMQSDPTPYYDAMDIFANAVPVGSGSMALLEAMVRGVPGVITFGGPEEAVVDGVTGLSVQPGNAAELGEALLKLIRDKNTRIAMSNAAREYIHQRFSMARVADDLVRIYAAAQSGRSSA